MKIIRMMSAWPRSLMFRSPYTCNIKITTRCNLHCSFCGLWSRPVSKELALSDYHYIADLLRRTGIARVVITGGEPLLRDDGPDIASLFARQGISTTLLTNGSLLTEEVLGRYCRAGLNDIGISLDSLDPAYMDRICNGTDVSKKAIRAIELSAGMIKKGIVQVMTTVSGGNLHEIPDIVHYVHHKLGAWSVVNPVNIPPSGESILSAPVAGASPPFLADDVDRVYNRLITMKRSGIRLLNSRMFLEASRRYLKSGEFKWQCDAGERYFTLFPDGGLAPCSDQRPIRKIMEMTPDDFRNADYIREVREVQNRCSGCIFSCWREASYLFSDPSVIAERIFSLRHLVKWRS